jgi:hypothetical protein
LNSQDFIREFVHNGGGNYIDLGNYDFGLSSEEVHVRDKLANEVTSLRRAGIVLSHERKVNPSYYIAVLGLLTLAFYFSIFFLRDALGDDLLLVAVFALFISPFVFRRFTSGFRVIGLYFAVCILLSLTVGSWEENKLGSGVIIFFLVGLAPYVASKIFARIWTESDLILSSAGKDLKIRIEEAKVGPIRRALEGSA